MTLTMTIVAPWNVWQCSDYRVTYLERRPNGRWKVLKREDDSVKFVTLRCRDGAAMLTYSGLAKVGHEHISDWVGRQVRGYSRTVDETLIRIREAATAELARPAKAGGVLHAFVVGAYLQRRPWAAVIANTTGPPAFPILDRFETSALPADEPKAMIVGEGQNAISAEDRELLLRVSRRRPKRPEDYSQLLANIHRRAKYSQHPARHTISEGCMTSYMPPSGDGGGMQQHWDQATPNAPLRIPPSLLFGIDTTDLMRLTIDVHQAAEAGNPMGDAEFQRRMEEALRRSTEPPKP